MPSTNKTEFLGLNQWIGGDKPKRDDFNEDNRIIDEFARAGGGGTSTLSHTLAASGWATGQTITNAAITATNRIDIKLAAGYTSAQATAYNDMLSRATVSRAAGSLTISLSGAAPNVDINIILEISGDAGQVSLIPVALLMPGKSALINRRFQIWQDGDSFTNLLSGYNAADMWVLARSSAAGTVTIQKIANGIRVINNSDNNVDLYQMLYGGDAIQQENMRGKQFTVGCNCAALAGSGEMSLAYNNIIIASANLAVGVIKATATVPDAARTTYCYVQIRLPAGANVDLEWFDCVEGDTITPPPYLDFGLDLMLCQQYYEKSYSYGVPPGLPGVNYDGGLFENGAPIASGGIIRKAISFKVTKARVPTMILYSMNDGTANKVDIWNSSTLTQYAASAQNVGTQGVARVQISLTAAATGIGFHWVADCRPRGYLHQ